MPAAVFVYSDWNALFPEFATTVTQPQATALFNTWAGLYLDNTDASPVVDLPTRLSYLYLITAHLAQLQYGSSLIAANPIVGRIDGATEGSVSFTTKFPDMAGMAAWFNQTKYGAMYWAATARYRAFNYVPGPRPRRQGGVWW